MAIFRFNPFFMKPNPFTQFPFSFSFSFPLWMTLLFINISPSLKAATEPLPVSSKVTTVTVYQGSAQVTRTAKVALEQGLNKLVFGGLSAYMREGSIMVNGGQGVSLVSVTVLKTDAGNLIKPEVILDAEDSLEHVNDLMEQLEARQHGLQKEKELMEANKNMGGTAATLHADDLEESMALYRKRFQDIHEELYRIHKSLKPLLILRDQLKKIIEDFINKNKQQHQLHILVQADQTMSSANIEFSYITDNCNWSPAYDIRIKDTHSPIQLVSKASISQQTGEDWENTELVLSTSDPNGSGSKPELEVNRIHFEERGMVKSSKELQMMSADMGQANSAAPPQMAMIRQLDTHIEFKVNNPYTVPSDLSQHQVELTSMEIPAYYAYGSVPKLDPAIYATAKVPALDLPEQIPGMAQIYFNGTFTGQTYLQPTASDSMLISLGKDTRLTIERTLLKELSSKSCFGSTKKDLKHWQIAIKNSRKEAVELLIEDQIPVSENTEIEVKLIESGGAIYDATTGKLTWKLTLEPEKSTRVAFSFEVKHPKDKQVSPY
jgi:uncharacterized protein (TIGR02231 family)